MPLIPFDGNIKKINNDKIAICGYPSTDNYEPITLSDIYVCQFGLKKRDVFWISSRDRKPLFIVFQLSLAKVEHRSYLKTAGRIWQ